MKHSVFIIEIAAPLIGLLCLLTACQPTPEKEAVVGPDDAKLQKILEAAPLAPYQYDAPAEVHDEIVLNTSTFYIDAEIEVTDATLHPVYRVERRGFVQEEAARIYDYFVPDATGIRDASQPSREELLEDIFILEQGIPTRQEDGSVTYVPNEHAQEAIAELNKQLESAPSEHFSQVSGTIEYTLPCAVSLLRADGSKAYCVAQEDMISVYTNDYGLIQMQSWILNQGGWEGEGPVTLAPSITQEQAQTKADQILADLGFENMSVAWAEKARMLDGFLGYNTLSTGWFITYVRSEGGNIPFDSNSVSSILMRFEDDSALYAPSWPQETVSLLVDETGARYFRWCCSCGEPELVNANVALLPFDQVYERMVQLVRQGFAWTDAPGTKNDDFIIYRILLTNCLVREKDRADSAVWMPTWIFVYQFASSNDTMPGYIAINALDGSRIHLIN